MGRYAIRQSHPGNGVQKTLGKNLMVKNTLGHTCRAILKKTLKGKMQEQFNEDVLATRGRKGEVEIHRERRDIETQVRHTGVAHTGNRRREIRGRK